MEKPSIDEQTEKLCSCFSSPQDTKPRGGHEIRDTFILSGSFFLVFTAYLAIQNLQSSLNQEAGLGVTSLSCLYGFIILSSILAPTILKIIGGKFAIVLAWILHVVYTSTNFYPKFATLLPSSILLGLMSGPLWTSQCVYITKNGYSLAERTGEDPHAVLSKLNGIFFTIYELTQISGNIVSSAILYKDQEHNTTSAIKSCGVNDCPVTTGNSTILAQPEDTIIYTLLGVFLVFNCLGVFLTATFLPTLPKSDWSVEAPIIKSVTSCFSAFCDVNMVLLFPFISFMAFEQAILWTDFTKSYISCPVGIKMVGFVMASYGLTTTISALVTSRLAKYSGRHILFAVAIIIQMAVFVAMFVFNPKGTEDLPYLFTIAIVWGVAEGIWQTQSNALVGFLFPDNAEPAFANYHFFKASSFTFYFAISTVLCVKTKLILVITSLSISTVLYVALEIKVHYNKKSSKEINKK